MDVHCERCQMHYEFDDALVSAQGTSVRCTQCGHRFRVRRPEAAGAPEVWTVRTVDGKTLEFHALRELKAAIASKSVDRDDVLTRGGGRPRRLASIAELEPFFITARPRTATNPGLAPSEAAPRRTPTPAGLGPAATMESRDSSVSLALGNLSQGSDASIPVVEPNPFAGIEDETTTERPLPLPSALPTAKASSVPEDAARTGSARPPSSAPQPRSAPPPAASTPPPRSAPAPAASTPPPAGSNPPPARTSSKPPAPKGTTSTPPPGASTPPPGDPRAATVVAAALPSTPPPPVEAVGSSSLTNSDVRQRSGEGRVSLVTPPAPSVRDPSATSDEQDAALSAAWRGSGVPSRTAGSGRWIGVLVLGGALVFGGIYVFQRFVKPEGAGVADARVAQLLVASDASLSAGDVDEAKAQLDRASAFAENDPRLVRALARLELLRAEPAWLELRILAGDDASRGLVERRLKDALDRARRAVERAASVDAQHPELALAQLDLKRLQGDVAGARGQVGGLGELASQPATLGSLGALDASEAKPDWPLAAERIGKAASAEGSLGRARAMLVYVFAASGDAKRARDELELLAKLPRPHVLEPALRRFVERVEKGGAVSIDQLPSASGSGAPSAGPAAGAGTAAAEAPSGGESPNVVAMRQAQEALGRGQMDAAERIYQGIVDKEPSNVEALTGLAQVARSRGQAKRAMAIYQRVLDANSTFLPALVSLADLKWDGGERSGAIGLYQRALAAGASGATADRARERSAPPSEPAPANTPPPSSGGESPPPTPRPDPAPEPPPPPPPPPPADVPAWEGDGKAPGGGP